MSVTRRFKGYFLHGLAVLLPSILTIWLFIWGYTFIQKNISQYINRGLVYIIALSEHEKVEVSEGDIKQYLKKKNPQLEEEEKQEELAMLAKLPDNRTKTQIWKLENSLTQTWVDGAGSIVGFVIAVIAVCIFGAILASYVGKTIWRMAENFIMNTPLLRRVYPYVKQITDFLLTQEEQKRFFSRVVAVEYPRKGIWSLGFVTGAGLKNVVNHIRRDFLTVLIPTSPTPFTGFVITVPKKQTIDLDMTIEEALRFVISGGVISPTSEMVKMSEHIKEKELDSDDSE